MNADLLSAAADRADEAHAALVRAVVEAHAAGVPVAHIAKAARITRPTVYRWVNASS